MIPAYYLQQAIARVESVAVTVNGTTNVQFSFRPHRFLDTRYNGIVIIDLAQAIPEGTTDTLPIVFNAGTGTTDSNVKKRGGANLTVADLDGTGIYQFYYNSETKALQLI